MLLETYGAWGEMLAPVYDPVRLEWLRLGGQIVIARLKGGPGRQEEVTEQLLAVARSLTSAPVAYRGQSFGATLGLMAMQRQPSAFSAVWADSPVTDLIGFPNHRPGELWVGELGDPSSPSDRERLLRLSPLHNITREPLPPLLLTTNLRDPVVHFSHALSFVEKAQATNPRSVSLFKAETVGTHDTLGPRLDERIETTRLLWRLCQQGSLPAARRERL